MAENKKSSLGVMILIVISILLVLFILWFLVFKDKSSKKENSPVFYNKERINTNMTYEYDNKDGVLTQIVDKESKPLQKDFVINGIILIGSKHKYFDTDDKNTIVKSFVKKGFNTTDINSSFYLNEDIGFYIKASYKGNEKDVKILVVPQKTIEEYDRLTTIELTDLAVEKGFLLDYKKPKKSNNYYVGANHVNANLPEGKYDILFTYKGEIAYFININMVKE